MPKKIMPKSQAKIKPFPQYPFLFLTLKKYHEQIYDFKS